MMMMVLEMKLGFHGHPHPCVVWFGQETYFFSFWIGIPPHEFHFTTIFSGMSEQREWTRACGRKEEEKGQFNFMVMDEVIN